MTNAVNLASLAVSGALSADANGNVGLGTTSPNTFGSFTWLTIAGKSTTSGGAVELKTSDNSIVAYTNVANAAWQLVTNTNHPITFQTNNTERARFNTTGAFVFAGGDTGANGIGITFPATQSASSNANTLDDYEEGTFTPTLFSGFSSAPTSYTTRTGSYTKVGRFVYFQIDIDANGATANASQVQISGMPFTSMTAQDAFGGAAISYQGSFNTNAGDSYHITNNNTLILLYTNTGVNRNGNDAGMNINQRIILFGMYQTA